MAFHQALLASGAPIGEINTLRKHFSAVKGGRLAMAAPDSLKVSLLLPDVPLRSLDALSSGPTSPDHSTVEDVRYILDKYNLGPKLPAKVKTFFDREDLPESPGNKAWRPPFLPKKVADAVLARKVTAAATMTGEDRRVSRFGFRDSALQPRHGGERPRAGPESRLLRGGRQQLRRLGLWRRCPLPAGAVPRAARRHTRGCASSPAEK